MKNLKINFIYNLVRIISNLIFPIITFPYVSRILKPEGIGKVTFTSSISEYFLLFASLGIPLYGIREVAKYRDNKEKLQKVVSEIFAINFITTVNIVIIYFLLMNFGILGKEKMLLEIMSLNILLTFIGMEWYFQGTEEYKYITIRSIIFKGISLFLIFIFVKNKLDYTKYALILVFSVAGSNILNFFKMRKNIKLEFKTLNFRRHLKPILIIFSLNLAISIYTNLDTVMLGYKSSEKAVGLYTSGVKLIKLVLGIVTSLSAVMLPRISNCIENNKKKELKDILSKAFNFLILISIPSFIGLLLTSKEIILIFSGESFRESIVTMKILAPIIIFIAFSNFIGIQILYPRGEEKKVLISVIIGAITNFSLNWLLIPKYLENGAAISTTIAEAIVLLLQIVLGYKYLNFIKEKNKNFLKIIFANIFLILVICIINIKNIYLSLAVKGIVGVICYFSLLTLLKEKMTYDIINNILKRRQNGKI